MNREIKFRVWILSAKENWTGVDNFETFDWNNRMRFVDSIHFPLNKFSGKDISCEPICENDNYSNGWIGNSFNSVNTESKKEYVLMQFTGLFDKNDKEIYEGDVLKTKYQDKAIMIWHKEFSCFCFETIDEIVKGEYQYSFKNVEIEIIGNIYENPELLDGSVVA